MKVKHFLLAFAAILFAACSNESNEQLITENQYQVFGEVFIDGKPADLSRASGGSWEGLGKYRGKDYVTVSYTPPSGYTVTQIREEPDKTSSNSSSHSFGINNKDHTVYADIKEIAKKYTNTVKAGNGGTASGTYTGNSGETHDIKATPKSGWEFSGWTTSGGATVSNSSSASTTAKIGSSDGTITANFKKNSFYVTASSDCDAYTTTVSGGDGNGNFNYGESCTVYWEDTGESEEYNFIGWYNNGSKVSGSRRYTFTVTSDTDLEARFEPME